MRNIKLTIAYDGADFHGWQVQPGFATIQGSLAEAARQITQEDVFVHGASRTDAGVHALGQVAHFKTNSAISVQELHRALNAVLPPAIRIMAAEEAGMEFHSRWMAQAKTYRYRIQRAPVLPPFEYRRALHYPGALDEAAMIAAAPLFEGLHDFTSFSASSGSEEEDGERETIREIFSSQIIREPLLDEIVYVVRGRSFLRYMVRKIAGTLLGVGRGRIAPVDIPQLFELRDRSRSGPTLPPEGLYLVSLEFPDPTNSLASFGRPRKDRTLHAPRK